MKYQPIASIRQRVPVIFLLVLWITPLAVAGQSDITLDFTAEPKIAGFEPPVSGALAASIKAAGGKIALDGKTVKQSAGSLRWDWHAGDVLRLRIPPFDSKRANGPYATWRPCVQFWIHPDKDSVDPLVLTTDAVTGKPPVQIPIALNHGGTWRRTILSYVYNMQVPAGIEPRHIILTAPATGSGTLHFDLTGFDLQFPTGEWRKPGDQEKSDAIARDLRLAPTVLFALTSASLAVSPILSTAAGSWPSQCASGVVESETRKTAPMPACTTLGLKRSAQSGEQTTCSTANQSAVRRMVPRLPGS